MDTLITFGDGVKALDDKGKVGGYLVRFGSENDYDLSSMKDYFTAETDFGIDDWDNAKSIVLFQHGQDKQLGKRRLGSGSMKMDNVGIWIEAQLNIRDEYEAAVYELAKKGKLGWSSGVPAHLVDREQKDNGAHHIKSWYLGTDASLTPNPAEYRNGAISLKSLMEDQSKRLEDQTNDLVELARKFVTEMNDLRDRFESIKTLRAKDGRDLSENSLKCLDASSEALDEVLNQLQTTKSSLTSISVTGEQSQTVAEPTFADPIEAAELLKRLEQLLN